MDKYYLYLHKINELYPKLLPAMVNKDQKKLDELFIEINSKLNEMKKLIRKYTNNDIYHHISEEDRERRRMNMLKNRRKKKEE